MASRILIVFLALSNTPVLAASLYVDPLISSNCGTYDTATRSCVGGSNVAFSTLDGGLAAVGPGDKLILRDGTYTQINIRNSGQVDNPIVIRGFAGEIVAISTPASIGLNVINQSDIEIRDLVVTAATGFGRIEGSTRIVVDSVSFRNAAASGTTGALKFVRSSQNRVTNSHFDGGSDLMVIQDNSNENVIQDNVFQNASHSLISIRCSSRNIIRANEFRNPDQKAVEIYDCEGVSDAPVRLDDTKRNVFEHNRFLETRASGQRHDYNAIQHGGQQTIARFNIFADNRGGGSHYQYYSDESLFVYENRLYNNTFYNNRCFAITGRNGVASRYYDNQAVNNLLYMNTDCSGAGDQVDIDNPAAVILTNNSIVDSDPGFVGANSGDFHLRSTSQQIDAGAFLTHASSSGSGSILVVDDASWFYDGFGIPQETGDLLRMEGHEEAARILSINFDTNAITVDRSLTWSTGDGVHLMYTGNSPDVGAFEFEQARTTPNPPSNLQ